MCIYSSAEPFMEIGRQIKAGSPFPFTVVSGYSNVGWGYLPTAEAYPLGGYEIEVAPFGPEAADEAVAAGRRLLGQLQEAYAMEAVVETQGVRHEP